MLASILISLRNYLGSNPYLVKVGRAPLTLLLWNADLLREDAAWKMQALQPSVCVFLLSSFMQKERTLRAFSTEGLYIF